MKRNGKEYLIPMKACRFAALALSGLLLVCTGCAASQEVPETSVPTVAPETLFLVVSAGDCAIRNEEGQTLDYRGGELSGSMTVLKSGTVEVTADYGLCAVQVPYSGRFTYELVSDGADDPWEFSVCGFLDGTYMTYCIARGRGAPGCVEYTGDGVLRVTGRAGARMNLTIGMPDSQLGQSGWVSLFVASAQGEVSLEARGNVLSFSGTAPQTALLSYGGVLPKEEGVSLELKSGNGTLDFSGIFDGKITVAEEDQEEWVLSVN